MLELAPQNAILLKWQYNTLHILRPEIHIICKIFKHYEVVICFALETIH